MFKRAMAATLSMVMILLAICSDAFATDMTVSDAATFLTEIGVITAEIADFNQPISREEFAVYTTRILKLPEVDADSVRYFSDVETYSYAAGAINTLVEHGYISISEDRKFRPQDNITLAEASKILVTAVGYKVKANDEGGFPVGYISIASRLRLFGKTQIQETVSYGQAFEMMVNTLERPILGIESVDGNGNVLTVREDDDTTLLTTVWDIYKASGTVNAVYGGSLNGVTVRKGKLMLDDETYYLSEGVAAEDYIGDYAELYFLKPKEDSNKTIVSIRRVAENENVTIQAADLQSVSASEITFLNKRDKKQTLVLTAPAFLYNGAVLGSGVQDKLANINKGNIVVKDGNNDGNYDAVIVKDYQNFLISSINGDILYDRLGSQSINLAEYEQVRIYNAAGALTDSSELKVDQILSVARSIGKECVEIWISESTVSGSIDEQYQENGIYYLTINGQKYPVEKSYAKKIENTYLAHFSAGESFTFKLDTFGNIAYAVKGVSAMKTGYLLNAILDEKCMVPVAKLKIFTADNKFEVYELSERIRVNGVRYREVADGFRSIPGVTQDSGNVTIDQQLIRYTLDSDNKIDKLQTASFTAWEDDEDEQFRQIYEKTETQWYNSTRLGKVATVSSNTEVFFLPLGESDPELEDCLSTNYSSLLNDVNYICNGYIFDTDNVFADAVVCFYKPGDIYNNNRAYLPITMVTGITRRLSASGEVYNCLSGFARGAAVEYMIPNEISLDGLEEGDLIILHWGINNQIVESPDTTTPDIEIVCKRKDIYENYSPGWTNNQYHNYLYTTSSDANSNYYRANLQISYGFVTKVADTAVAWDHEPDGVFDETANISGNITFYDSNNRKGSRTYLGKAGDLITYDAADKDCSKILYRTRAGAPWDVFVYQ